MPMRATIGIYEDPTSFTYEDVWGSTGKDAEEMKARLMYTGIGFLSLTAVTAYAAWKYVPSLLPFGLGKNDSL
jgi:hypothetical protein